MGWLIFVLVAVSVVLAFWKLRGATIYLTNPGGYSSIAIGGSNSLHPVPRDRYERLIRRFLKGDLFDSIWVSRKEGEEGGVVASLENGKVQVDANFLSLKEPDRVDDFRKHMKSHGYVPVAEYPWNVGMGVDLESITLTYEVGLDEKEVLKVLDRVLENFEGPEGKEVYVHVWSSKDGPAGSGIRIVPERNLLGEVP